MLRVWGRRSAFNVQKVLLLVGELELPHEHIDAGGSAGGLDAPEFRAMNPPGRIPLIQDSDAAVWESHSILRYLAAKHGAGTLWSEDAAERSLADRWMDWSQATLQPDFMQLFWSYYRTPEESRNARRIESAAGRCALHFRLLDEHLADNRFLAGERFTIGDIPAATSLYRYFEMGIDVPDEPNVARWYRELSERPAYREHIMRPFDELYGRLDF
jgi:glutathione S-transferase